MSKSLACGGGIPIPHHPFTSYCCLENPGVKKHGKVDIKLFLYYPHLLDFTILFQIFYLSLLFKKLLNKLIKISQILLSLRNQIVWFFFKVNFWNIRINVLMDPSVLQGISITLKCWPDPFLPSPQSSPQKTKTSKSARYPLYEQPLSKFCRTWLLAWNVPSSKRSKTHFLKKQNILFPKMKWEHIWTLKYKYTVAKSKNQWRVRLFLNILFLLGS